MPFHRVAISFHFLQARCYVIEKELVVCDAINNHILDEHIKAKRATCRKPDLLGSLCWNTMCIQT